MTNYCTACNFETDDDEAMEAHLVEHYETEKGVVEREDEIEPDEFVTEFEGELPQEIVEKGKQRNREQIERKQQEAEIAAEHNFDRDIDHSQPHQASDMERAMEEAIAEQKRKFGHAMGSGEIIPIDALNHVFGPENVIVLDEDQLDEWEGEVFEDGTESELPWEL